MKNRGNLLIKTLQKKKLTLAIAESVTCGLAAHNLTLVKGTSDVLQGGIICYSTTVKCGLLKVDRRLIKKYTPESQQVTDQLAKGFTKQIDATIYAALTGLANKGGSESVEKPVGTIFFSVYYCGKMHRSRKQFKGSPLSIQKKACDELYRFILDVVLNG